MDKRVLQFTVCCDIENDVSTVIFCNLHFHWPPETTMEVHLWFCCVCFFCYQFFSVRLGWYS